MRRHGRTAKGTMRWYCPQCRVSGIRSRPDTRRRHEQRRFTRWLTGKASLSELAAIRHVTRQTLSQHFRLYFTRVALWQAPSSIRILILDGTYIHRRTLVALIALNERGEAYWQFVPWETAETWGSLLIRLPCPKVVVCDGQKGLLKKINALWPETAIQRCHFHVAKLARRYLTTRPKTQAGQDIKALVHALPRARTLHAARGWRHAYEAWERRYAALLAERTHYDDGVRVRWWYTHRNLRGVRSLIHGAYPHLFTYLQIPGTPNTTNHLEGGVNAGIAEALRLHRGLRLHQKKTLVSVLLAERNRTKKATRKFT